MEIKTGMYVRTTDGIIEKVIRIGEIRYMHEECYQTGREEILYREDIKKASFNIIDLIEFGDFVNGQVVEKYRGKLGMFFIYENCWKFETIENYIKENELFGIVTKEQFKSMEYEV